MGGSYNTALSLTEVLFPYVDLGDLPGRKPQFFRLGWKDNFANFQRVFDFGNGAEVATYFYAIVGIRTAEWSIRRAGTNRSLLLRISQPERMAAHRCLGG